MPRNRSRVLLVALTLFSTRMAAAEVAWKESLSPNFIVYHESAFMPAGLLLELGKIHGRMRRDLSMFSPWIAKERVKIYLYAGSKTYLNGEFEPPSWSNGVALYDRRLVATHEQKETKKLFAVLAHEMSHLLFESYWAEENKMPPVWLNEGLSMMEEATDSKNPEDSDWHRGMWVLVQRKHYRFKDFFNLEPQRDLLHSEQETVSLWYVQAYSVVYFLYREHTRMQFVQFCRLLRDGETLEKSLWKAYRIASVEMFEQKWRKWINLPEVREKIDTRRPQSAGAASASPPEFDNERKKLKSVGFGGLKYKPLVPDAAD